jgi:GDP-L-fucose synthase
MMEAARQQSVKRFLFASSVAVYGPAETFREDDVWKTFPSPNDRFAGWAKRMGELQAEAYKIEFGWKELVVTRPANVYGPYDNFDLDNAMVVPSLISRAASGQSPLVVWGDGSSVRDFVFAGDVARGMLLALEKLPEGPVNLGSGAGASIKRLVDAIIACLDDKPLVQWDKSKPAGDKRRVMDISRAKAMGWRPEVSLEDGVARTLAWFKAEGGKSAPRHDVFAPGGNKRLLT